MKIGLFFGSFNPIHHGHLIIANIMATTTDLDEVWFVVSPKNPFKSSNSLLHEHDRYEMVEVAIKGNPNFMVSDIEFHMPRPSFTIDTMTYLADKHPHHQFFLIIGSDNLLSFHKWKNSQSILDNFGLLVYRRPGYSEKKFKVQDRSNIRYVEAPLLEISATFIRKQIAQGHSIQYLTPDPVIHMIKDRKFYL